MPISLKYPVLAYREALSYVLDGPAPAEHRIDLKSGDRQIGEQSVKRLEPGSMWTLTAAKDPRIMRDHFLRFLTLTPLRNIHWINLNRHRLEFVTLPRSE